MTTTIKIANLNSDDSYDEAWEKYFSIYSQADSQTRKINRDIYQDWLKTKKQDHQEAKIRAEEQPNIVFKVDRSSKNKEVQNETAL